MSFGFTSGSDLQVTRPEKERRQDLTSFRFVAPIVMALVGTTVYHLAQKAIPATLDPRIALTLMYGAALALSLLSFAVPWSPDRTGSAARFHWAPILIGVCIVAVELGFLLAYRQGWKLSLASAVTNVMTAALLLLIGLTVYREQLNATRIGGLLLCLVGLALIL
jgi:multidrug transporter EmrE-like cation transporter